MGETLSRHEGSSSKSGDIPSRVLRTLAQFYSMKPPIPRPLLREESAARSALIASASCKGQGAGVADPMAATPVRMIGVTKGGVTIEFSGSAM